MAAKSKKTGARWDFEVEQKHIDILADILEELDGKMMTKKKKEAIVTTHLNVYVSNELNRSEHYTEKEVCNKVDTIMKKRKAMYVTHQKKGETSRECTQDDVDFDMEAGEATWPNFITFFGQFKNIQHWAQEWWRILVCLQVWNLVLVVQHRLNRGRMLPRQKPLDLQAGQQ